MKILALAFRDNEDIQESQRLVLTHRGLEPEYFIGPRAQPWPLACLWGLSDRQSRRAGEAYDLDEVCGATGHPEQHPSTCSLTRKKHRVQGSQDLAAPGQLSPYIH